MFKRFLCLAVAALMLMTLITACSNDKEIPPKGNITELSGVEPGDVYAVFDILGFGTITYKLFPELAPKAVEEWIIKAERGFYDNKNIHRVIQNKLIQGGSLNFDGTDGQVEERELYDIEASDYARNFYGALSLVANENKKNYCQFFMVTNKEPVDIDQMIRKAEELLDGSQGTLNDNARKRIETNLATMKAIPEEIKQQYMTRGGDFELDGTVTVFGQLVEGSEILDALASVEVAAGNKIDDDRNIKSRPIEEIIIKSISIIKIPETQPEDTPAPRTKSTTSAPPTDAIGDLTEKVNLDETLPPPAEENEHDEITITEVTNVQPEEIITPEETENVD